MIEAIMNLLGGSIVGLIGSWVNTWLANKRRKADQEHELAVMREERETRKIEAEMQMEITKEEFSGKAFNIAQVAGNRTALSSSNLKLLLQGNSFMRSLGTLIAFLLGITDVARHALRPFLTGFLLWVCVAIIQQYIDQTGGIGIDERMKLVAYAIKSMFQLLNVCVSYWFGYRMTKKLMEN